ncbi:S8 family peptidase [Microbacterium sp. BH-3-3-3]|uniref:S8 family peptidase n=1 Tax=Microbacterium sp. BH-3-3-3 TaxID=1906742 RepID=UPI0008929507|nr:S8 family peptidase [Microbacterium sp. BH-3-3-3]AOX45314.1 hypothetical protein BJP65_05455 [Microbacterium sp. BH-3-3-3]
MADATGGGRIFVNGEDLGQTIDRVSRGGEKYHPQSLEQARDLLEPQLGELQRRIAQIPPELRANRVVIEAEVWANYLAISYFPASLVSRLKFKPLGSRIVQDGVHRSQTKGDTESVTKSYLFSVDAGGIDEMVELLDGTTTGARSNKALEEVRQFTRITVAAPYVGEPDDDGLKELLPFEAVLHPDPDTSTLMERSGASPTTLEKFVKLVEANGGRVHADFNDVVDGLTFVALDLPASAVDDVTAFNPLRSLSPTPRIELATAPGADIADAVLDPAAAPVPGLPEVVVFDGGVQTDSGVFHDHVVYVDLTGLGFTPGPLAHGSAVTACVLFGQLTPGEPLPPAAASVKHYQVVEGPDTDSSEYPWLLRQIRTVVERDKPALVNLSLGPRVPIDDREPHRWTAVLDKLARETGTLFITAAGNDGHRDRAANLHRVQVPGDMVNGLCVGAFVPTDAGWDATDYSGRGPGRPGSRVQPAVVAFGGDVISPRFPRLRADGQLLLDGHGTSYAAPLVTHLAAELTRELGPRADAPTLRALIVHSATRLPGHDVLAVGYGRIVTDVNKILQCGPGQVTAIYQGSIARDEVRSFALPHPTGLTTGNFDVRWTLAFTTGTDSAEAGDYTNAGLETTFRPHALKHTFANGRTTKTRNIETQAEEIAALLAEGYRPSRYPESFSAPSDFAPETALRDHGKWESISRWQFTKQGRSLHKPTIDISHVTRENGRLTTGTDEIEFSLIVTISAHADVPLYALAEVQYPVLTALPIQVETSVDVDVDVDVEIEV